jgi:hypothetical protein
MDRLITALAAANPNPAKPTDLAGSNRVYRYRAGG